MEHFSEQRWADFVRGISGPEFSREIRAHLNDSCSKCKTAHYAWSQVQRLATEESAYEPPENVVRLAKLGFVSKPAQQPRKWTLANLVFDSFNQPLVAGVRGALNVWQVIYEAEGLTVDLRFGRRAPSKTVHLVGQVLDRAAARAMQSDASVELSTEQEQLVATTATSALGEFHFEFEAKDQMWLSVKAEGRNTIRIPLTSTK
jgi:anti-sigma factor RsiW